MVYRAIGLASDDLSAGLTITFTEFQEQAGKWTYEVLQTAHFVYETDWASRLKNAATLSIAEFQHLHIGYGQYLGQQINKFIEQYQLQYKVALIAFYGSKIVSTAGLIYLGEGAAVAALTQLPVVNDFYSVDKTFGGEPAENNLLKEKLAPQSDATTINSDVLVAFMGILRWRQEYNVFAAETGASRNSIGGALWTGQEA